MRCGGLRNRGAGVGLNRGGGLLAGAGADAAARGLWQRAFGGRSGCAGLLDAFGDFCRLAGRRAFASLGQRALDEGFAAAAAASPAAAALLRRFAAGGREADGSATRDRLKLIARVANPDQWAVEGPLSGAEHRLLVSYNEKPLLTRPQQHFFTGPGYLEVDLDVHSYAYLARKALTSFTGRLGPVVYENAFVIQGNGAR